jgi:hypothetical protein
MHCDKVKSLLGWFYDDELDASERRLVAQHLEHCPGCAAALAALGELDRVSRQLTTPEPPSGQWDRIARRLQPPGMSKAVSDRIAGRRRFLFVGGALAASVAGALVTLRTVLPRNRVNDNGMQVSPIQPGNGDPVVVNLALLSPDDRRLAESQRICAADQCNARLGSGGCPIKVVLDNEPVFLCCKECEQWARAHPAQAVAKVHTLDHRQDEPKDR